MGAENLQTISIMLAAIIVIGTAIFIATCLGLHSFIKQLEDFEERAKNFADLMDEADELSNKEDEQ